VAKVTKVTKDWHETFGLERETIHIQCCDLGSVFWSVENGFIDDLVREVNDIM
jgi:hypothetical protein